VDTNRPKRNPRSLPRPQLSAAKTGTHQEGTLVRSTLVCGSLGNQRTLIYPRFEMPGFHTSGDGLPSNDTTYIILEVT